MTATTGPMAGATAAAAAEGGATVDVCALEALVPERGAAAMVAGQQVALVRLHDGQVAAVQQRDPYSGAMVLSRGLVGTRGDRPVLISPMYKQAFDLETGACLDSKGEEPRDLTVHDCQVVAGRVHVRLAGAR